MKRLTLDQTWEQCLAMWKWISRQCLGKSWQWCTTNVARLKREWLEAHGILSGEIDHNCFFCEYDLKRRDMCANCPAQRVDDSFRCNKKAYSHERRPRLFYAKLKELNKIRLAKV